MVVRFAQTLISEGFNSIYISSLLYTCSYTSYEDEINIVKLEDVFAMYFSFHHLHLYSAFVLMGNTMCDFREISLVGPQDVEE